MNKTKFSFVSILVALFIMVVGFVSFGISLHKSEENIKILEANLNTNQDILASTINELETTKENLQIETEKSAKQNESLITIELELENKTTEINELNTTLADLKSEEYEFVYIGNFKLTHYCNEAYEHICGYGDGLTAIGTKVKPGTTIAVDPKVIPYGTEIYIEGYGWRVAEDCGGGVKGNHIDVAVDTHSEAMANGVKYSGVWVLVKKNS